MALKTTPGLLDSMLARAAGGLGLLDPDAVKEAMLSVARDAFVATDSLGRIIEWNPAAEQIFGWSREEVLGLDMCDLIIPEELHERHRAGVRLHQETGEAPIFGLRLAMPAITRSGRIPVELTVGSARVRKKMIYVASMRKL